MVRNDAIERWWTAEPASHYLGADDVIETFAPSIVQLGRDLRREHCEDLGFARAAFEWVRDNVAHAYDAQDPRVTLTATEVLRERVGLCFAKSHLLAAVLRSQGVPTGLCYQRLGSPEEGHVVHGLVAVYLEEAWHRQDPRGNKPGVDAQFSLGDERLAWAAVPDKGEIDYARVFAGPAPVIVETLKSATNMLTCALPAELA